MNDPAFYRSLAALSLGILAAWLTLEFLGLFPVRNVVRSELEQDRRASCRRSLFYALFEPTIDRISTLLQLIAPRYMSKTEASLNLINDTRLKARELIACRIIIAVIVTVGLFVLMYAGGFSGPALLIFSVGLFLLSAAIGIGRLLSRAEAKRRQIRARLPFAIELMAVLIESGGTEERQALEIVRMENSNHPLGIELGQALEKNPDYEEAMRDWGTRSGDEQIREFTFALRMAYQSGSPIKDTLRSMADQFLYRRLQSLEQAAERAKVHITWPGMIIMVACLVIVTAPFVLSFQDALGL